MIAFYVAAAILASLTVLLVMVGLARLMAERSEVGSRLQAYTSTAIMPGQAPAEDVDRPPAFADRLNEYIGSRGFAESIAASLGSAAVKLTVPEYVLIKIACALVPFAVLTLVTRSILPGLLIGPLCFFLPNMWLRRRRRRRQMDFGEQLPQTLDMIVGGLRAGFSLQHSMVNVSQTAPEPTASEFARIGQELQLGVPLMTALDNLALRIKNDDLEMIISVFKIHSRVGGNLAVVLETVGTTIRERVKLRREIRVITSMQRMSGYVLGGLPPVLAFVIFLLNPSYMMELFHWDIWLCIPIGAATMMVIGFLVIRKLVDIKV
ncbi:MAG TPA: type II secretion system F family protein [Herpetosiphonaceae bacterium]|nr:type II secretion system F family protein [Herpetosiphonaceae bacterium]